MNVINTANSMLLSGTRLKECRKAAGLTQSDLISKIKDLPENKGKPRNEFLQYWKGDLNICQDPRTLKHLKITLLL